MEKVLPTMRLFKAGQGQAQQVVLVAVQTIWHQVNKQSPLPSFCFIPLKIYNCLSHLAFSDCSSQFAQTNCWDTISKWEGSSTTV